VALLFGKKPKANDIAQLEAAAIFLDKLLGDKEFVALNHPTIADCHCSASALSIQVIQVTLFPLIHVVLYMLLLYFHRLCSLML